MRLYMRILPLSAEVAVSIEAPGEVIAGGSSIRVGADYEYCYGRIHFYPAGRLKECSVSGVPNLIITGLGRGLKSVRGFNFG